MTAIQAQEIAGDPTRGIHLECVETVLVKFTVSKKEEVLSLIPARKRLNQAELDAKHIEEAKDEVKAGRVAARKLQRGSIRPGHYDTGVEVYHQELGVGSPTLAECLMKAGYGFRDVHFFEQRKGKNVSYVVVFGFVWDEPNAENVSMLQRLYAHYAAGSWTTYIWDNPNLTTTVNHTNLVRNELPSRKIIATKKYLFIA